MRLRAWTLSAFLLLILSATACRHGGVGAKAATGSFDGEVTVRVVNHSWLDVTIYILQGTRRDRIGNATATATTDFRVSLRRLSSGGEYRLFGDPVGSRATVRSEPLHAQDGDIVIWTLEDDLARSTVEVR